MCRGWGEVCVCRGGGGGVGRGSLGRGPWRRCGSPRQVQHLSIRALRPRCAERSRRRRGRRRSRPSRPRRQRFVRGGRALQRAWRRALPCEQPVGGGGCAPGGGGRELWGRARAGHAWCGEHGAGGALSEQRGGGRASGSRRQCAGGWAGRTARRGRCQAIRCDKRSRVRVLQTNGCRWFATHVCQGRFCTYLRRVACSSPPRLLWANSMPVDRPGRHRMAADPSRSSPSGSRRHSPPILLRSLSGCWIGCHSVDPIPSCRRRRCWRWVCGCWRTPARGPSRSRIGGSCLVARPIGRAWPKVARRRRRRHSASRRGERHACCRTRRRRRPARPGRRPARPGRHPGRGPAPSRLGLGPAAACWAGAEAAVGSEPILARRARRRGSGRTGGLAEGVVADPTLFTGLGSIPLVRRRRL